MDNSCIIQLFDTFVLYDFFSPVLCPYSAKGYSKKTCRKDDVFRAKKRAKNVPILFVSTLGQSNYVVFHCKKEGVLRLGIVIPNAIDREELWQNENGD